MAVSVSEADYSQMPSSESWLTAVVERNLMALNTASAHQVSRGRGSAIEKSSARVALVAGKKKSRRIDAFRLDCRSREGRATISPPSHLVVTPVLNDVTGAT